MQGKKSLLSAWRAKKQKDHIDSKLEQRPSEKLPLAYNQEAIFFLQRLNPGNPFYNFLDVYDYQGDFDLPAFRRAIEQVVQRHDAFRTQFTEEEGVVYQRTLPERSFGYSEHSVEKDIDALDQAEQIILREARKPFVLESDPLLRVTAVRVSEDRVIIGLTIHHIIIDKWSMAQLREELAQLYLQGGVDQDDPTKPTGTYGRYAQEQRARPIDEKSLSFWKDHLGSVEAVLDFPLDYSRPAQPEF